MSNSDAPDKDALDALLVTARDTDRIVSPSLRSRILADAARLQDGRAAAAQRPRSGIIAEIARAFGGWPAFGGLATAAMAGLLIGLWDPGLEQVVGLSGATDDYSDLFGTVDPFVIREDEQ